jgi:hypothetical protein
MSAAGQKKGAAAGSAWQRDRIDEGLWGARQKGQGRVGGILSAPAPRGGGESGRISDPSFPRHRKFFPTALRRMASVFY